MVWILIGLISLAALFGCGDEGLRMKKELEDKFRDSIVYLSTDAIDARKVRRSMTGTGFIISKEGYIITADHVIPFESPETYETVMKTKVRIGKAWMQANLVERDSKYRLVLLKIEQPVPPIEPIAIGNPDFVRKNMDFLYSGGFPRGTDLFFSKGELQSLRSPHAEYHHWLAQIDETSGDSGGPVFFQKEVVAVVQDGFVTTQKNKHLTPIIYADSFFKRAQLWPPWRGRQTAIDSLDSRERVVTSSLNPDSSEQSKATLTELSAIREYQHNKDESVRRYRHRLYEVAGSLYALKKHFPYGEVEKAVDSLDLGKVEPAIQLLKRIAALNSRDAGEASFQLGAISEANVDFRGALDWYRTASSKPMPRPAYFDALATMAHHLGDQANALQWAKEAVRLREPAIAEDETGYAIALCRAGEFNVEVDPGQTIRDCERAAAILKQLPGNELAIATIYDNIGAAFGFMGDFEKAVEPYRKALDISERASAYEGGSEARKILANTSNNLAGLYRNMGRHRDSLPFSEKAISVNTQVYGESHPRLGTDLIGLGNVYRALGNYTSSREALVKAHGLITSSLGFNNRLLGAVLMFTAPLEYIQKNNTEALRAAHRALAIFRNLYPGGESVPEMRTHIILAELNSRLGQHPKAHGELDLAERIINSKHTGRVDDLLRLTIVRSSIYLRQSKATEATARLEYAETISRQIVHKDNPLLGELSLIKGILAIQTHNLGSAEVSLEKAQQIFNDSLGEKHPKRAYALKLLADVQKDKGDKLTADRTQSYISQTFSGMANVRVVTAIDL